MRYRFAQVVASLLVSVVLLGFKLSALKRLVQVNQRRTELKAALVLLEPKVETEKLAVWLADVEHDAKQREERIAAMDSAAGRVYTTLEAELLAKVVDMFRGVRGELGRREAACALCNGPVLGDEARRGDRPSVWASCGHGPGHATGDRRILP
jgi:hypothetical protein